MLTTDALYTSNLRRFEANLRRLTPVDLPPSLSELTAQYNQVTKDLPYLCFYDTPSQSPKRTQSSTAYSARAVPVTGTPR